MAVVIPDLIRYVCEQVLGKPSFTFNGQEIDVSRPFPRKSIVDLVKEYAGIDLMAAKTVEEAREMAKSIGIDASECSNWGKVVQLVFDEKVEANLIQPVLVFPTRLNSAPASTPSAPNAKPATTRLRCWTRTLSTRWKTRCRRPAEWEWGLTAWPFFSPVRKRSVTLSLFRLCATNKK